MDGRVKNNPLALISFFTSIVSTYPDAFPNATIIPLIFNVSIEPLNVFIPTPS